MDEISYYGVYINFQEQRMKDQNELLLIVKKLLRNKPKPEDAVFRRCPNCREVWVKVVGCDGGTTCGARPNDHKEAGSYLPSYYSFEFTGFLQSTIKKGFRIFKSKSKKNRPQSALFKATKTVKAAGCGANINWLECPPVPIEEMQELYKACPGLEDCVQDAL